MRKTFNKLLAALMVLAMLMTLLPIHAIAADEHTTKAATRSITAGTYVLAANVGGTYYALPKNFDISSGKINGVQITVTDGAVSASDADVYAVTIAAYGSNYTISNGSKYLKYSSGTNLSTDTAVYEWTISAGTNGSYRIASAATTNRAIVFRAGSYYKFGAYATSNVTSTSTEFYDVELLPVSGSGGGDSGGTTETIVSTASITNGNYVVAANVGGTYYAMANSFASKISGTAITVSGNTIAQSNASAYVVTITKNGSYHTIRSGSNYLGYASSTNLSSVTTAYDWAIVSGTNGTYRAIASTDNTRCISFQTEATRFGAYSLTNVTAGSTAYYDIELIPVADDSTTEVALAIPDGQYVIAASVNGTYYAMSNYFDEKLEGVGVTVANGCVTAEDATDYVITIAASANGYTIANENGYLKYSSGTNLGYSATTAYEWKIEAGVNGTYRINAATSGRALAFRADTYFTFGGYAISNVTSGSESYFDVELLAIGDPADYVKETFTLVTSSGDLVAGDYVIVSQAINSNNAYYAMSTAQESGQKKLSAIAVASSARPEKIVLSAKDLADYVWTLTGSRTSFKLENSAGNYLANSSSAEQLTVGTTATTWAGSVYSTSKYGFHISANKYYISLRDDLATMGANGNPLFGSTSITTTPSGHIYMNMYKACGHASVTPTAMPATCLESGMSMTTCNDCGEVISWTSTPALGHDIVYTSNSDGTHSVTCSACDYDEGTANCIYSDLACYLCGSAEPENDYSGRYYFATVRGSASSTYYYMTFDLVGTSTKRYAAEDSGLTSLPSVITAPISNKVYVIEKNEAGTYRIFAEGLAGDNCLAWEVDANASENSGAFADTFNAYELTIGLSGEANGGNKIVNIYFVEDNLPRYLSLNNTTGNNYFAWYTSASSQRKDIVLIPVEGEATCLHTNRTTVTEEPTCVTAGKETIYCADCGVVVGENELLASGHALKYDWVEDGWHQVTCANCDYSVTEACTLVGEACVYCSGGDLECFQLVTSPSDLSSDRYVIIAAASDGDYIGDYSYYGIGLRQDSNHNAINSFGMNFDTLPTEIYLEGVDTANLVWSLTGNAGGFTLTTDDGKALYHNTGDDLFLGTYTPTTWTAEFSTTAGYFAVKHNGSYYLALRTDLDTLEDSDVYSPLVKCAGNTSSGNYKMFFYKKYSGCLHINTSVTLIEPTCTTNGSEKVVCLDCGETITSEVLYAYGHDPFAYEATEPTCAESGNLAYWYCADCDCYFLDELCAKATTPEAIAIAALGHSWDDGQVTTAATCTTSGVMTYICYTCTASKTEVIDATGHFYTRVVTPPTCTQQGYTTHTCLDCGDSYISSYTAAFGHNNTYTNNGNGTHNAVCSSGCGYNAIENCNYIDGVCVCGAQGQGGCSHSNTTTTTTPATCTTSGSTKVTCNDCGTVISTTTISPTGHSYTSVVTAPTCTTQGYTTYTCSSCGYSYKSNYVGVLGHSYTSTVTAPTCGAQGYTTYACSRCDYSYKTNYTAAIGHSYTYTNNNNGTHTVVCKNGCGYSVTASCTYTNGVCVCGALEPEVCNHTNQTTTTVPATCTTDGTVTVTCNACGEVLSTMTLTATGHNLASVAAKEATCTENGCNKHWACTNCNAYFADANGQYALPESFVIIAATGHNYVNDVCTNCGLSQGPSYSPDSNLTMIMSISVGAEMQVMYTILNSKVKTYESFYLEVVKEVAGGEPVITVYGFEDGMLAFTPTTNASGAITRYQATYTGIYAMEMGDSFTATLYAVASDGTVYYGPAQTSSIKSYLLGILDDATQLASLKTLAVDMLNYGAAAQMNFAYDTNNLVNQSLTPAQLALGTQGIPEAENNISVTGTGGNITASVSLQSKVTLYVNCVYSATTDSNLIFLIRDPEDGSIIEMMEPSTVTARNCRIIYDNVGAAQMRKPIIIELYDKGILVSKTLQWSVEGFVAQTRADSATTEVLLNVVNAMLTYGDSADVFMKETGQ